MEKIEIEIEMPLVAKCGIKQCAFNVNQNCRAKAITVGDSIEPECDTFLRSAQHTNETRRVAGVGACKVRGCQFNHDFECGASSITVDMEGSKVHCLTYSPKAA